MLVYLAVNRRTGLKYVGATKAALRRRQAEHRSKAGLGKLTRFHSAIREYGWEAFDWHVLSECKSIEEMLFEERRWVVAFDTQNLSLGYNMTKGGTGVVGCVVSDETRRKLSEAAIGRIKTEETRRKLSIANKGKKPSEATMMALRGRKLTEEERRRISECNKGRKHIWSDDQRQKYYAGQQRRKESDHGKIPHSHLAEIRERRGRGDTFASIGETYGVHASTLFSWLNRRAS